MKLFSKAIVAGVIGITAAFAFAAPSYAAATSCYKGDEVCSVSTSTGGGYVAFSTSFPGVGGSAPYEIRTSGGALLCSGSMGFNDTRNCTISYSGTIKFKFYKSQNPVGSISLQSS